MRKSYILTGAVLGIVVILVVTDYFALFGTRVISKMDFISMSFKPVDEETGAPVVDVHTRCFQMNNRNACSETDSGKAGIVEIKIPVTKLVTSTWLFEKDSRYQETADPKLHIMFIHYDYANPVETFYLKDIPKLSGKVIKVPMPKPLLDN